MGETEKIGEQVVDAISAYKWPALVLAAFLLLILFALRRIRINEVGFLGLKLTFAPRRIDVAKELSDIRRMAICGDNIGLRIAVQKCNEVLKIEPTNGEALRLKETLTNAISQLECFEVKIDSFVHTMSLRASAALFVAFALIDIASWGFRVLPWLIALYPVWMFALWFLHTVVHEYGHLSAVRLILLRELGVEITRPSLFRFIDFHDALTVRGLGRLLFALRAPDTTVHVDSMIEEVLAMAKREGHLAQD